MPHTVRLHVAALRFFFVKTLKRRYLLDDTPYPKAPRRFPSIFSIDEVSQLIEAAASFFHRTMLMVLYATGMRKAELRHSHPDRAGGGRPRSPPLSRRHPRRSPARAASPLQIPAPPWSPLHGHEKGVVQA